MGTMIGLGQPVGHTYAEQAAKHGIHVAPSSVEQAFRRSYRRAPPLAFPGLAGRELQLAEMAWWGDRIRDSLGLCDGESIPQALVTALFQHYAQPSAWRVYADVPANLKRWHQRGLALAVVSNFDSRLPKLLDGLGLTPWLKAIVISSTSGAAKPDPAPFLHALQQLDLEPQHVWHVGDSPEDAAGATAAGVRHLSVRRP